jgi:uncharacterized membrane-anchored protein YjiN (DUF445 family)
LNAIEILEQTKVNLSMAVDDYFNSKQIDPFVDWTVPDTVYQESRSIIKAIAKELGLVIANFIRTSRTIEEAVADLTDNLSQHDNQYTLKNIVRAYFNEYIDILEEGQLDVKIIHVKSEVPDRLTFDHIKEDLTKCDKRFVDGDYSGAITSARSLVEGVCNEIIVNITGESLKDKLDLPALFTRVRRE